MCVQSDLYITPEATEVPRHYGVKNVNTGKFHFSNKDNFCRLI